MPISMSTEILMFVMLSIFAVILTVFGSRQASSMREIERVAQDYYAMQLRAARRQYAGSLDALNPLEWVSNHLSNGLPKPVQVVELIRVIPEIGAADLRTNDNRRVVVSIHPKKDLLLYDRRSKSAKRPTKAEDRISKFAVRPLLTARGWGVETVESTMSSNDEFFDMEADAVGTKLGLNWKMPTRLYFHVVD